MVLTQQTELSQSNTRMNYVYVVNKCQEQDTQKNFRIVNSTYVEMILLVCRRSRLSYKVIDAILQDKTERIVPQLCCLGHSFLLCSSCQQCKISEKL